MRRKDFWPLHKSRYILDKFIPSLSHESDGLILQPWDGDDSDYQGGTCDVLLKWKFAHLNSVDFLLEMDPSQKGIGEPLGCCLDSRVCECPAGDGLARRTSATCAMCCRSADLLYGPPVWDGPTDGTASVSCTAASLRFVCQLCMVSVDEGPCQVDMSPLKSC